MISQLFRRRKESRTPRPSFRPTLETLESREVPSSIQAQVSAALADLPQTVTALGVSIANNNKNTGNAQFSIIQNDINTLSNNASKFVSSSRLQIDTTLFIQGFQLVQQGYGLIQQGDAGDGQQIAVEGFTGVLDGYFDYLNMSAGMSNGNLKLL